jgi:hypothetical protein
MAHLDTKNIHFFGTTYVTTSKKIYTIPATQIFCVFPN